MTIKEEYIHNIAFQTIYDHYEFTMAPFGITNAPTTLMCPMISVLSKYLDKLVLVFLDDILVYSNNREEDEGHLRMVLQVLREHQLYAKLSKCELYRRRV